MGEKVSPRPTPVNTAVETCGNFLFPMGILSLDARLPSLACHAFSHPWKIMTSWTLWGISDGPRPIDLRPPSPPEC